MTSTPLSDEQAIAEVLTRYATGIDRRDWALLRSCFTGDVHADYGDTGVWDGGDAITDAMEHLHADMGHTLHRLTNMTIAVDGDAATARTYVDARLLTADGTHRIEAAGFYDDQLVPAADGWRIARRVFTMVDTRVSAV